MSINPSKSFSSQLVTRLFAFQYVFSHSHLINTHNRKKPSAQRASALKINLNNCLCNLSFSCPPCLPSSVPSGFVHPLPAVSFLFKIRGKQIFGGKYFVTFLSSDFVLLVKRCAADSVGYHCNDCVL